MSRKKTPEPYEVGYGKPPKANQFKPGQSGNRKGRPKKPKNTVPHIKDELDQTITITENGKKHRITKRAAIYKRLVNDALKGDARKIELVSRLSDRTLHRNRLYLMIKTMLNYFGPLKN